MVAPLSRDHVCNGTCEGSQDIHFAAKQRHGQRHHGCEILHRYNIPPVRALGTSVWSQGSHTTDLEQSIFHLFGAHSEHVARKVLKLDYLGIILNVSATCVTSSWFGFKKQPHLANIYISLTLGLSITIVILFLKPGADGHTAAVWRYEPQNPSTCFTFDRVPRSLLIAGLMATGYVPLLHAYLVSGTQGLQYFPWLAAVKMLTVDIVGVLFYITRFPESRFPETFDIWVGSTITV
jgi:adiponectin receptor